jgi:hypothetical protein
MEFIYLSIYSVVTQSDKRFTDGVFRAPRSGRGWGELSPLLRSNPAGDNGSSGRVGIMLYAFALALAAGFVAPAPSLRSATAMRVPAHTGLAPGFEVSLDMPSGLTLFMQVLHNHARIRIVYVERHGCKPQCGIAQI